jgi:hypothetical protein
MNIMRSTSRIAAIAAIATVGLSGSAIAAGPDAPTGLSAGKPRPVVKWDHAAWKKCYSLTYAQWREDGHSPTTSQNAADLTCGTQP